MLTSAEESRSINYNPHRFIQMIRSMGGVETARALLNSSSIPYGFEVLREKGRLDLSMEALITDVKWRVLFTDDEVRIAAIRLMEAGYRRQIS